MHITFNLTSGTGENDQHILSLLQNQAGTLKALQVADEGLARPAQPESSPQTMFFITAELFNTACALLFFFASDIWCLVVNWNNVEFGALRRSTNSNCFQRSSGVLRAPCCCQHSLSWLVEILSVSALASACVRACACICQTNSINLKTPFLFFHFQSICHLQHETTGQQLFYTT